MADLNKKRVETAELFGAVKSMPENLKADAIIEVNNMIKTQQLH